MEPVAFAKVPAGSREPLLESQLTGQFFRRLVITTLRRFAGAQAKLSRVKSAVLIASFVPSRDQLRGVTHAYYA